MSRRDCEHGSLARSCEVCELEARVAELEAFARDALDIGYGPGVDSDDLVCLHDDAKRLLGGGAA